MPPVWGSWESRFAITVRWLPDTPRLSALPSELLGLSFWVVEPVTEFSRTCTIRRMVVVLPALSVKVCSAIHVPGCDRSIAVAAFPSASKSRTALDVTVPSVMVAFAT